MQDDPSLAIALPVLLIIVFLIVGFIGQELHPVMSGPDGSVITITESEYQSNGETRGGDVFVAILDSTASAIAKMVLMCCPGGALFWIGLVVIVFLAIAGIGAAAG